MLSFCDDNINTGKITGGVCSLQNQKLFLNTAMMDGNTVEKYISGKKPHMLQDQFYSAN